jgi:S-DNA-T family DNA segregation ATPase FtsK/SpoIIIE
VANTKKNSKEKNKKKKKGQADTRNSGGSGKYNASGNGAQTRSGAAESGGQTRKNGAGKKDGQSGVSVKESRGSREITAVILAAIGVFLIFSLFGKTGQIGRIVTAVLYGLIGKFVTIVLLVMLFVLAFTVLRGTSKSIFSLKNCLLFGFMLLMLAAMIHTFAYSVERYEGKKFFDIVTTLWTEQQKGGGVIGGLISVGLQKLVARPGTLIILIPATLILAMVLFSLSLVRAGKTVANIGGKFGKWVSGVVGRFKKSDEEKELKRLEAQERARKKEEIKAQEAANAEKKENAERARAEAREAERNRDGNGETGDNGEIIDDIDGYFDEPGGDVSDEHIELVSARGRKREVFLRDLEKQKEQHRAQERKIMSQEDDDFEAGAAAGVGAATGIAAASAGASGASGAGDGDGDYDGDYETRHGYDPDMAFPDNVPEIDRREHLPETDATIPTKVPSKSEEIRVVTCNEEAEYELPPHEILRSIEADDSDVLEQEKNAKLTARKLEDVMRSFGIEARVIRISIGSTVTMFELQPQSGVKVSRIKNLSDDIALNLAASGVRILAPIPGKAAIGIEVPNEDRRTVYLKELVESDAFQNHRSKLAFCLGEDISGNPIIADIARMPHVLIAGTTGAGKSVCINCIIMSLLYRCSPNDVRLIMIDPKVVELQVYNSIPHLLIPVVTEPRKAAAALSWTVQEMENRYRQFAKYNLRDINAYNDFAPEHGLPRMPRIVIIIDELADLMMVVRDSVEEAINRIAQKARAAGMHLIVATQRPSVDVITGLIKANIPSRIAFTVSSVVDSKTILDYGGAEKLLGRGDMLYHPVDFMKPLRVQGGFVSDTEIEETVDFLRTQKQDSREDEQISSDINNARPVEKPGRSGRLADPDTGDGDPMLADAVDIAIETKQISASFLQRKLGLGYSRASRLIDQMEEKGYISARDGNNPRKVLISINPLR